jgi:hypothetical protein
MTTDLGPTIAIDVRDVSGAILAAIEADAGHDENADIWATDADGAVAANGYTPTGTIHVPFRTEADAESERRRVTASRTDPHYRYPNGTPMPIWTPTTYYWRGDDAT